MQKRLGIAVLVVGCIVLSSCAGVKEMISLEGGGDVRPMGGNRWEITTSGNKYVERKDIYNRWDVKAGETCKGPLNVVSRNIEIRDESALVYLVGIVECTSKQKPKNSGSK